MADPSFLGTTPIATAVDVCVVRGDEPLTPEGVQAAQGIIAAVRQRAMASELAASRMATLRAADIAAEVGLRAESARFLHQAAKILALLEATDAG